VKGKEVERTIKVKREEEGSNWKKEKKEGGRRKWRGRKKGRRKRGRFWCTSHERLIPGEWLNLAKPNVIREQGKEEKEWRKMMEGRTNKEEGRRRKRLEEGERRKKGKKYKKKKIT
jgi:hypothetical protein